MFASNKLKTPSCVLAAVLCAGVAEAVDLQSRIDAAASRGGGVVEIGPGVHETKPIVLRSNVTLKLHAGAILEASTNLADYAATPGERCFVYAENATNVAIVGHGVIDGRGGVFRERSGLPGESQPQDLPVLIRFSRCRNVRLENFTYRRSAAWGCHLRNCDGVTLRGLVCRNHVNETNDGIDVESANVLIDDCDVDSDDDALVFKTESDPTFPVTNVVVRSCRLASCCNAVKFGTGSYGDFRDITISDCQLLRPTDNWRFKWHEEIPGVTNRLTGIAGLALEVVDGGRMEDVTIRNIEMVGYQTPIFIRHHRRHAPRPGRETCLRGVLIENVRGVAESRVACSITGVPGLRPRDITLKNVDLTFPGGGTAEDARRPVPELETAYPEAFMFGRQPLPAYGFFIRHADNVVFESVRTRTASPDARPPIVRVDVASPKAERTLRSPDGNVEVGFAADSEGLFWTLSRKGRTLVKRSPLGFVLAAESDGRTGDFCRRLSKGMRLVSSEASSSDSVWTNRLYRREVIRDRYKELKVLLEQAAPPHARLGLVFRAYDEGCAFRYFVPEQSAFAGFQLMEELTEWRFAGDPTCWATLYPDHVDSQEKTYDRRRLSDLPRKKLAGMPLLVRTEDQTLALTEACLSDWAGFFFRHKGDGALQAELSPLPDSPASTPRVAVIRTTPAESPWRVVMCGDDEMDLLSKNDIILNLNPPPEPGADFGWVKAGASGWDWWVESNNSQSTEQTIRQVDFAAEMGWPYHTIDAGWYGFARRPNHGPDVRLVPRRGFDLERILRHARARGVGIWVWIHWQLIDDTGVEETFAQLERWGVKGVKTDFLNRQDQWMVNWYERVARAAARHRIMVNFHGAMKPTGRERTWPNCLTREGILGGESSKWGRFDPRHTVTLPFTRFLIGPADYTPGGFGNVHAKDFVPQMKRGHRYCDDTDHRRIWAEEVGTRAHALALTVAFDSPLMMMCDWPERYRGAKGVELLKNLPTVWKRTLPLDGAIESHYAVARETFDGRYYLAAFSKDRRDLRLELSFLGNGKWTMRLFADDPEKTPSDAKALRTETRTVVSTESLDLAILDEGGAVAVFEMVE